MQKRRFSGWFILAGIILGVGLFAFALIVLWAFRPPAAAETPSTAVLTVIIAPSSTATLSASLSGTPTPTGTPAVSINGIGAGVYVQISGTGGDGLRLRAEAGTSAEVRFLGYESEVLQVTGGPKNTDGYIWWYLTAPYDTSRSGWAVSDFIRPIDIQP